MRYKHIKTGVIIDSPSKIIGKAWVTLNDEKEKHVQEPEQEYIEEEVDLNKMTNKELDEFAENHEIELTTEDKKNKASRIAAIAKAFE